MKSSLDRRFMAHGFVVFAASIMVGAVATWLPAPRMGVSCHLNGLTTGMMLVLLGLTLNRMTLSDFQKVVLFWLAVTGVYCSFAMHLFATIFPSGYRFMPIASGGITGTDWQEAVVFACNIYIGLTLIPVSWLAVWGLWQRERA